MSTPLPTPQRWERPFNFPPGFWKRQLPTKVLELAIRGDVDALRQVLAERPQVLNQRGAHNRTLLWEAARRGKLAAVKWLVEGGAELDATGCYNSESYVQITPYCAAIYYHRADVAAYLLSQGAQLDIFRAAFLGDQPRSPGCWLPGRTCSWRKTNTTLSILRPCWPLPWRAGICRWQTSCPGRALRSPRTAPSCCSWRGGRRAWT